MKGREIDQLYGTVSRGVSIKNEDRLLDRKLNEAAKLLNLAIHEAKGDRDLLSKTMPTAVDLVGFRRVGTDVGYSLLNFRRCFPPEDPSLTTHLS